MIKKTRISINTNIAVYLKTLLSFFIENSNENTFLEKLKVFLNSDNLMLCSQGRVAAYNIFKLLINENKKEIIIAPYTLPEVVNAIVYAGGSPIYVDIDINTGLPDQKKVNKLINENTACIVITHLYSNNYDILKFKEEFNNKTKIVEDAAINLGAKIDDQKYLGTLFDYGFFSFGVMKNLCTFHGGAIFCKDKNELNKIQSSLKQNKKYPYIYALKLVIFCMLIDFLYNKFIFHNFTFYLLKLFNKLHVKYFEKIIYPGVYPKLAEYKPDNYNYNFCEKFIHAGIINIDLLESRKKQRMNNVKYYEKYINKELLINTFKDYTNNSFLEYPILLKKNKNRLVSKVLLKIGYDVRHTWYINSVKFRQLEYKIDQFPNCDILNDYIITLPTNINFQEKDIINICKIINDLEN